MVAAAEAVENLTRESKSSQKILKQPYYHQTNGHGCGKGLLNFPVGAICLLRPLQGVNGVVAAAAMPPRGYCCSGPQSPK